MGRQEILAAVVFAGYAGTVYGANWLIGHVGQLPVGFGLAAPAGVYAVGLAFGLRDALQKLGGRAVTIAAIGVGTLLSVTLAAADPRIALASALAFALSEALDMAVYTPLEARRPYLAVIASNTVGLIVDSGLFLSVAFGSLDFFWGQVLGKFWMTLLTVAVLFGIRRVRRAAR
jgi:queuosine precursor transporter